MELIQFGRNILCVDLVRGINYRHGRFIRGGRRCIHWFGRCKRLATLFANTSVLSDN